MPFIRITSFPLEKEKRTKVATEVVEVFHRHNPAVPREMVYVVFEPIQPDSWAVGGTLVSDMKK